MQIETSSSLFTVSSDVPEFMRLNSQQQLFKESEIFTEYNEKLSTHHSYLQDAHPYRLNDKATGVLVLFDDLYK